MWSINEPSVDTESIRFEGRVGVVPSVNTEEEGSKILNQNPTTMSRDGPNFQQIQNVGR